MAEHRPADFAPRREAKPRVRIVECRLDPGAVEKIAGEVFAARLTHLVGFEERAANAVLRVLAEAVPCVGVGLDGALQQILQEVLD